MRTPRLVALAWIVLAVVAAHPLRAAAADTDPAAFMTEVSGKVLQLLNDKQQPAAVREQQFEKLVTDNFDVPKIARFVLGQSWRTASDDEKQQFGQVFEHYMVQVYWMRFGQYNGQSFKVTGQQAQSDTLTTVSTQIVQPSGQPPVKVDWVVTKEDGGLKITDVSIEGISQAVTYRDEFASVLEQNGGHVSALIAQLSSKLKAQTSG
jgi:phospholipid transport system substrate-binding protein